MLLKMYYGIEICWNTKIIIGPWQPPATPGHGSTLFQAFRTNLFLSLHYIYWAHSFGTKIIGKREYEQPNVLVAQLKVLGLRDPNLPLMAGNNVAFDLL
jgi:hypothetical protein